MFFSAKHSNFTEAQNAFFDACLQDNPDEEDLTEKLGMLLEQAELAVTAGHAEAMHWLGRTLYYGEYDIKIDKKRGLELLEQAAELKQTDAMVDLANIYAGDNFRKYHKSAQLFLKASEAGHLHAQCRLAEMYKDGIGVEQDRQKALDLLQSAAENGSAYACLVLGLWYIDQEETEYNPEKGLEFLQHGCTNFNFDIEDSFLYYRLLFYVGWCYLEGVGTEKSLKYAQDFIREAADGSDEEALFFIEQQGWDKTNLWDSRERDHIAYKNFYVGQDGSALPEGDDADAMMAHCVGWKEPKKAYKKLVDIAKLHKALEHGINSYAPHFVMTGPPGSGRKTFARILAKKLFEEGYLETDYVFSIDLIDLLTVQYRPAFHMTREHFNDFTEYLPGIENGLLLVKDFRPSKVMYHDDLRIQELKLAKDLYEYAADPRNKVLMALCQEENGFLEMERFFDNNRRLSNVFRHKISFEDFTPEELSQIYIRQLESMDFRVSAKARDKAMQEIENTAHLAETSRRNARLVHNVVAQTLENWSQDASVSDVHIEERHVPDTNSDILANMDTLLAPLANMTGLENVKKEIAAFVYVLKTQRERKKEGISTPHINMHSVFTGPPGTGKTTVARILGKILKGLGYLKNGHVVEVGGSDLVGKYMGQAPSLVTEKVNEAEGGILFIDEAYTLGQSLDSTWVDSNREEAIATLLKLMEDRRDRFVVIAAGYDREMIQFIETNSGLKSRFSRFIEFENYTSEDLGRIFASMCAENGYVPEESAVKKIENYTKEFSTTSELNAFGNARGIRNLYEKSVSRQAQRILENHIKDAVQIRTIAANDIITAEAPKVRVKTAEDLERLLEPLNNMVGLKNIKDEISNLACLIQMQALREEKNLSRIPVVLHSIFSGPPGTGKTTVARILGRILSHMGYLSKGHVVEVDKSGLVGQYLGQTPAIVKQKAREAHGGILFVDEAYALSDNVHGGEYGYEALTTLLKIMEDNRNNFIVIAAGYEKEMKQFIDANSGLQSRFPHHLKFKPYTTTQMLDIFMKDCAKHDLSLSDKAKEKLRSYLAEMSEDEINKLGNGRLMRNIFEKSLPLHARRMIQSAASSNQEALFTLQAEDIFLIKDKEKKKIGFIQ